MDEAVDRGLVPGDSAQENILRSVPRADDKTAPVSNNSNNNIVGYNISSLDVPYPSAYQEDVTLRPEIISCQDMGTPGRQNYNDGDEYKKFFGDKNVKDEYCKIHDWGVDSLQKCTNTTNENNNLQQQQTSNNVAGEINTGITVVPFECFPNQERIRTMQASLGKLLRIGTLAGTTWTTENPKTLCRLILPDNHSVEEGDSSFVSQVPKNGGDNESHGCCNNPNNPLMIVEKIVSESDRLRVTSFIGIKIQSEAQPDNLKNYMAQVKRYGFDHIIIIGKLYCGILFLDCYGRIFEWDPMDLLLWPLGDYFKGVVNKFNTNRVAWGMANDGSVFEVENYLLNKLDEHNTHLFPKKGKKSKNSKKNKHH
ncbi:17420_t:CDS:2 [Acaulospora morrowiae]|uniref:17420_t:CDS:1 n=1 Tax=Acaulospora morrowiae TaxID=94023 RepID=A0A9N8VAX3_9GLOM|nr:17420_t:CDS:2 [Acaulospora morrowiae]